MRDWTAFVGDLRQTAVIAMTLAALVAIAGTWWRTRAIAPTAAVIMVAAVAVWAVGHPTVVRRLARDTGDEAREQCQASPGSRGCGDGVTAQDLDTDLAG